MSCIEVRITNLSPPLLVGVERLGEGLQANAFRVDEPLVCMVEDALKDGHLKVTCGIVINEVLEIYPPSVVPALYEVIEMVHSGDINDPIPYVAPMEIFKDKYYIEEGVKFICTRDSGVALTHFLNDLVGIYVEFV